MAKKAAFFDPGAFALETLAAALSNSAPRVLFGTSASPGFFQGSTVKTRQAANHATREQWLEDTGLKTGSGARAKALYRLTPKGIHTIIQNSPALGVLKSLGDSLRQVQATLQQLSEQVNGQRLEEMICAALDRLKPPELKGFLENPLSSALPQGVGRPQGDEGWQEEIVRRANQADAFNPLSLPELFRELKRTWPDLGLGRFHDGIRALRDAGRIRLRPFTRAYADIASHREALFLDGEVMYYVQGT